MHDYSTADGIFDAVENERSDMTPTATLGESPSAKILREALATVRRDALPNSPTVSP